MNVQNIENEINAKVPQIIREAGEIAEKFFANHPARKTKADNTFVTEADTLVQQHIVREFSKFSENIPVIAEEDDFDMNIVKDSRYTWVIDPIDGTSQYANDLTNWVIAIALLRDSEPYAGWIYQPILKDLYYAPIGDSYAYHENKNNETKIINKIDIDKNYQFSKKDTIYFGSRTFQDYKPGLTKARFGCLGSLTMHAVETVMGNSLATFSYDNKVWDICAVAEIAKRVNLQIKYISGTKVDYKKIITGKDKSLGGDLIICHENIFSHVKTIFVRINTFDVNPLKKWALNFNHNEILYISMVKVFYPLSLLFSLLRIIIAVIKNTDTLNVLFSIIIMLYFTVCWYFSRKELRDKNYKYTIVYFIFYFVENIFIQSALILLLTYPSIENRKIFYILSAIYMFCRIFLILISVTLNTNFKFTILTVLGFIFLYFICGRYNIVEYITGFIFFFSLVLYAIKMDKWIKFKYLK